MEAIVGTLGALLWKACFAQEIGVSEGQIRSSFDQAGVSFSGWAGAGWLDLE